MNESVGWLLCSHAERGPVGAQSSDLIAQTEQVYTNVLHSQTKRFSVDSSGNVGNALVTAYSYGYLGQVCKVTGSDGSFIKTRFAKSGAVLADRGQRGRTERGAG